ncbi:hypothetical protein M9C82_01150 [SAR86 cluster bacterium]|nr:hypothetical protein M9C82_01150 [SAR86 cluster bacterium]
MSNISFEQFATEFAKDLEIEGQEFISLPLKEIPEYDSMGLITASLTIERLFDFEISLETLDETDSLNSLFEYCVNYKNSN